MKDYKIWKKLICIFKSKKRLYEIFFLIEKRLDEVTNEDVAEFMQSLEKLPFLTDLSLRFDQ